MVGSNADGSAIALKGLGAARNTFTAHTPQSPAIPARATRTALDPWLDSLAILPRATWPAASACRVPLPPESSRIWTSAPGPN